MIELQKSVNNAEKMVLKSPIDGIVVMQALRRGNEFAQVLQTRVAHLDAAGLTDWKDLPQPE